jgi:isopentenyl diphosphate isomerase/L-lactate dehydrogenase-like FMN-dependent dehydrogenase
MRGAFLHSQANVYNRGATSFLNCDAAQAAIRAIRAILDARAATPRQGEYIHDGGLISYVTAA